MNSLLPEDQNIPVFTTASIPRNEGRLLAKKQALLQIHEFMDSYQKDMVVKLTPHTPPINTAYLPTPRGANSGNDDLSEELDAASKHKQNRAKLHQIWLAMKPTYKPKTTF
mgnify:CR=1 FL=1